MNRVLIALAVVSMVALIGLLFVLKEVPLEALTAFLGVILGGSLAGLIQYSISELDRNQELKLAALDKRLQAHQDAYSWWRKLMFADKESGEVYEVVEQCQNWWEANCVFLTREAREAFLKAYLSASDHAQFLAIHADSVVVKAAWADVSRAGDIILQGVHLPPISELEAKRASTRGSQGDA